MCDENINTNHVVIYYDPDLHEEDGNGWCLEPLPGSVTYRFDSFNQLNDHMRMDTWWASWMNRPDTVL